MHLTGIDHVQLAMPPGEEERARHFYGETLGLTEVEKPPVLAARGGCWFEAPGVIVHMGVETDFTPARKAHPAFLVDDYPAFQERLKVFGVDFVTDTAVEDVQRLYAHDPFGNRLEFIRSGDGFSQR